MVNYQTHSELTAQSSDIAENDVDVTQKVQHFLRIVLIALLTIMYGGGGGLLTFILAPYLYAVFYLTVFVCVFLYVLFIKQKTYRVSGILPYLIWIIFYSFWGTIVLENRHLVVSDVVKLIIRHVLFLSSVQISLSNSFYLERMARLMQVAVLLNVVVSLMGFSNPQFVTDLASRFPSTGFVDQLRPAGLWINPNEASFAFLLGFLMSFWTRGTLAWVGRIAAAIGIYLSVSRTGVFVLLLCIALYVIFEISSARFSHIRVAIIFCGLSICICAFWFAYYRPDLLNISSSDNRNIDRIINYSDALENDRGYIANLALNYALNGPWYGYGIFTFQEETLSPYRSFADIGAHDIYLAVFGEIGLVGLFVYLVVLSIGVFKAMAFSMSIRDKIVSLMMWMCYFIIGFAWHGQFVTALGVIFIGILFCLPRALNAGNQTGNPGYNLKCEKA